MKQFPLPHVTRIANWRKNKTKNQTKTNKKKNPDEFLWFVSGIQFNCLSTLISSENQRE